METNSSALGKTAASIEQAINAALTMDANAQKHLKRLSGCVLALNVTSTKSTFYFGVKVPLAEDLDGRFLVELLPRQDSSTVQLGGSILSLVKLAASKDKAILFRTKELSLSGDSVRIQQIQAFLDSISIDWEAILANFIGDVPAHLLGSGIRSSVGWGLTFTQSIIRDTEEYIKYELRLFPNKFAAKKQFAAIDELYKATENLEKRIKKALSKKMKSERKTETNH